MPQRYIQPIIKTVIKRDTDAHGSTTWKVAYADLMTAMMAFFLLLWITSALSDKQKTEIAHYFTPTAGLVGKSGAGVAGGLDATMLDGKGAAYQDDGIVENQLKQGELAQKPEDTPLTDTNADAAAVDSKGYAGDSKSLELDEAFMALNTKFAQLIKRTDNQLFTNNLQIDDTRRDMHISVINSPENPMFNDDSDELTIEGIQVMDAIANIVIRTQRKLMITGYTTSHSFASNRSTQWEPAVQHANLVLRFLIGRKVDASCIDSVVGKSETLPMGSTSKPEDRVIITLLRDSCRREQTEEPALE